MMDEIKDDTPEQTHVIQETQKTIIDMMVTLENAGYQIVGIVGLTLALAATIVNFSSYKATRNQLKDALFKRINRALEETDNMKPYTPRTVEE